jgi:uncharacterized protein (TIGR02145 family)
METKYYIKSKVIFILALIILSYSSCHTSKEITQEPIQDVINDYCGNNGVFVDERDGAKYKWVKIGDQIWMAENLAYKADSGCIAYKYKERKVRRYGYYYSWGSAVNSCPDGWHLPTEKEIDKLQEYIGEFNYDAFDSLQKNKDYGLNLKRYGYYDSLEDKFKNIRLPYMGKSIFWLKNTFFTQSGQKSYMTIYKDYFWRRAGKVATSSNYYYPVRCIKD